MMAPMHRLGDLVPGTFTGEAAALLISAITADSRAVEPGTLFVAMTGSKLDGRAFVTDAVAKGAAAIIGEFFRPADLPVHIAHAQVSDARLALSQSAAAFYPRQPRMIVAVTGTSGKSSVADFTRQIFTHLRIEAASLGTIGVITAKTADHASLTTPDPVSLHRTLDQLAGDGITHLAMEASSHGLDQRRLDGVRLSAAAFLNLGRDHLDYHVTMAEYLSAKLRLFALLPSSAPAIINADCDVAEEVLAAANQHGHPVLSFGRNGKTLRLISVERNGFGQKLTLEAEGKTHHINLPLAGDFQASNALAAATMVLATGEPLDQILAAISHLKGVPGRLERVGEVNGALAVVDYAHKPDALAAMLETLRPYATGKLICVFGCGGDRDKGKRPLMGRIAVQNADVVIVTDDNPRSEAPGDIRAEIMAGARSATIADSKNANLAQLSEINDRRHAIQQAVSMLQPGDVLVVAGKGHETGQIIGMQTLPFSDHEAVRAAIARVEP